MIKPETKRVSLSIREAEEHQLDEMCKEFKDKSDFITPAIRDFICEEVFDAIEKNEKFTSLDFH